MAWPDPTRPEMSRAEPMAMTMEMAVAGGAGNGGGEGEGDDSDGGGGDGRSVAEVAVIAVIMAVGDGRQMVSRHQLQPTKCHLNLHQQLQPARTAIKYWNPDLSCSGLN